MKGLIEIKEVSFGGENSSAVDALELHQFLQVKSRFNDWIANRIKKYDFRENQDYISFTKILVKGRPSKSYTITMDMAKELSMVENNEQGRAARRYFIECERNLRTVKHQLTPMQILAQQAQFLVEQERINEEQQRLNEKVQIRIKELEAKTETSNSDYYSVLGYARLNEVRIDVRKAATVGRKCSSLCKKKQLDKGRVKDVRFGWVYTYPSEVLEVIFRELQLLKNQKMLEL